LRFILIFFYIFLISCKTNKNHSDIKETHEDKKEILVVLAGGFSSCPDDFIIDRAMRAGKTEEMYQIFGKLNFPKTFQQRTGNLPTVFTLCYSGPDSLVGSLTQYISGRFAWNLGRLDKNNITVQSFGVPQGDLLTDVSFLSHIKSELKEHLDQKANEGIAVDLYLVGHSYGGFTSIHLAEYFASNLRGLITIDPISMLDCQAKDMATKVYSTLTMNHPGCQTHPKDSFSFESIRKIQIDIANSDGKKWWLHMYQRSFPWLRSDEIKGVTVENPENRELTLKDFNRALVDGDYHSQMGRNGEVWDSIHSKISSRLP
jgi:hypothetical protein